MRWTPIPLALLLTTSLGAQERVVVFTKVSVIPAVANTMRIAGVMARGVWLSRADIDRRLAGTAAANR